MSLSQQVYKMKPSGSKVDTKKRKRDVTTTKVHAQRKFAQVSNNCAGPSSGFNFNRERDKSKSQTQNSSVVTEQRRLINAVPTKDLMTFLCFKQSPLLPKSLYYIGDTLGLSTSTSSPAQPPRPSTSSAKKVEKSEEEALAPSAPAVQALRLKYQEQRRAKQKPSSVTTLAKKVKGKNLIRTRSTVVKDDVVVPTKPVKPVLGLRSGLKRSAKLNTIPLKKMKPTKLQRAGLRSGGKIEEPKKLAKDSVVKTKKIFQPVAKKGKNSPEKKAVKVSEEFSSDDNEPLEKKTVKKSQVRTRSQGSDAEVLSTSEQRPMRRSKLVAAGGMDAVARQLLSPSSLSDDSSVKMDSPKKVVMKGAVKKSSQNVNLLPSRPSTRKNPVIEKPVIKAGPKKKMVTQVKKNEPDNVRKLRGKIVEEKPILMNKIKKIEKKKKLEVKDEPPKRPVRKCSTIDKMWIDVDGFTSDEEDFFDARSITVEKKMSSGKTRGVKKEKEEPKSAKVFPGTKGKENESAKSSEPLPSGSTVDEPKPGKSVENIPKTALPVTVKAEPCHSNVPAQVDDLGESVSSSVPASHALIARLATGAIKTAKPSALKWEVKPSTKSVPCVDPKSEPGEKQKENVNVKKNGGTVRAASPISSSIQTSSQSKTKMKVDSLKQKRTSVVDAIQQKLTKAKEEARMNDTKTKTGHGNRLKKLKDESELSEESTDSSVPSTRKRGRRPSPRAEVVTRRERPKRQCSTAGPSWIDPDSDDSSFQEDLFELIRRSEMEEKKRESAKKRYSKDFSDSDDEPLMKKPIFSAPSPGSFVTTDTNDGAKNVPGKSEVLLESSDSVVGTSGLGLILPPSVSFHNVPREPINTHGLDLLSVVAANNSSERIEKWLMESRAGKGFTGIDEQETHRAVNADIPDPVLHFVSSSEKRTKKPQARPETPTKRPPTSVQDLLKLRKERRDVPKPAPDLHSDNCQCDSCFVRKAWVKNKQTPDAATTAKVAPLVKPDNRPSTTRKLSFLERMRERERKEALVKPQTQPFSPSNESSVYAFEPEPEKSVPAKRTSSASDDTTDDASKQYSNSIAVQVNFDSSVKQPETTPSPAVDDVSTEISTQTDTANTDANSQMFYIPVSSSTEQAVIQGVTVKLGTEGPMGPNQKVVMQATWVTKPPNMPSMHAVVMPQQKPEAKNTPPVGTVQPTTRRPPSRQRETLKNQTRLEGPQATSTPKPTKSAAAATSTDPEPGALIEAPTFYLTEKEFQDPLEFFERIRPAAEPFGICRIVPPSSFKPDCKVADDMRFTAYNQYVHRLFHRWGPSTKETAAMKKYLKTQSVSLKPSPCVGGVELDLPRLFQAVQTCGGLVKVMQEEKWQQIADLLRIPKAAHDRATKLDAICQLLLPYVTLTPDERNKLFDEVDADWKTQEEKIGDSGDSSSEEEGYLDECEECIVKGRSMALSQFYRIARNTMSTWFKSAEPGPEEVEAEFWKLVTERKYHVCVHSASIDSSGWGYGFPVGKNNFAKHPWNLKVLTNNCNSVLRSLGSVMGVNVPILNVGMVFGAFCWYRDPHCLPWVEYLHTGAPKIWYGISDDNSSLFRDALTKILPKHIKNKRIWLPCDTAMAPPERLTELGVPLSRITQYPGQFVVVFPRAFTSSLCTGYLVSESVFFARPSWLQTAEEAFRDIRDSAESSMFSLDNLLLSIAGDARASLEILNLVLPMVKRLQKRERDGRQALRNIGLVEEPLPRESGRRRSRSADPESQHECEICRATLFLSMVSNSAEETVYCLEHGLQQLVDHEDQRKGCKLLYTHDQEEIDQAVQKLEERIEVKVSKKK